MNIGGHGVSYNSFILFRRTMACQSAPQKQHPQKLLQQGNQPAEVNICSSVIYLRKEISAVLLDLTHIDCTKWKQLLSQIEQLDITRQNKDLLQSLRLLQNLSLQQLQQKKSSQFCQFNPQQQDYLLYLLKTASLGACSQQWEAWRQRQFYLDGEYLLKHINSIQVWHQSLNKQRIHQLLLLNRLNYCVRFDLLQKGLQTIQLLNLQIDSNHVLQHYVQVVNNTILMRMGCQIATKPQQTTSHVNGTHSYDAKLKDNELCMQIIALNKYTLPTFLQTMSNQSISLSGQNLYNLSLVCRRFNYYSQAAQILIRLINAKSTNQHSRFKSKCLAILSQVFEESGKLIEALAALQQMQVQQYRDVMEWEYRKLILIKKIKLQKTAKTCPIVETKRLALMCGLQNELNQLISDSRTSYIAKATSKQYESNNLGRSTKSMKSMKSMKKLQLPNLNTMKLNLYRQADEQNSSAAITKQKYKNIVSTKCQSTNQFNSHFKKSIMTSSDTRVQQQTHLKQSTIKPATNSPIAPPKNHHQKSSIVEHKQKLFVIEDQPQTTTQLASTVPFQQQSVDKPRKYKQPKKTVKFHQQGNDKTHDIIYEGEGTITNLFLCEAYSQIESSIRSTLLQLQPSLLQLQPQPSCSPINKFILKCTKWYRQIGKDQQAISLLTSTISQIDTEKDGLQFKKDCLKILGQIYHNLNDNKNASKVYLQLANLGLAEYYDKLGQLSMLKQHYSDSIKYYETFNELKHSIYSKSKLAHAYSKLPVYKKKAVDMLNQILFQNKNGLVFRQFCFEEIEDVQKAVLLLVSIYMSAQTGMDKAKMICQKFLQINFSAYPIYYMLGIMYEEEGRKEDAFNAFLTALKLKPNHIPSLIKIVNDIGIENDNNYEVINILRKAYVLDCRNWELLKLLIQSISLTKQEETKPSVQQLVRYAKILQKAEVSNGDMDLQIEMVWIWAFEVIQNRRRKEQIVEDNNENEINMRLGEINMIKGNFKVSEFYLKKVLTKLQQRRKRTERRRGGKMKLQFEALQRLSYIKTRQSEAAEIKSILGGTLNIGKNEIEERQTMLERIIQSGRL